MNKKELFDTPGAFLGRHLENLSQLIESQSKEVFQQAGIEVPVKSCKAFMTIGDRGRISSADIAREIQVSHQLVKQKLTTLEKRSLIGSEEDPLDKRKRLLILTPEGKKQYAELQRLLPRFERTYNSLYEKVGFKLIEQLERVHQELLENPLYESQELTHE
ncbi:MAG: MarR family transcriptional regulator [Pseudomonadota bacterium]